MDVHRCDIDVLAGSSLGLDAVLPLQSEAGLADAGLDSSLFGHGRRLAIRHAVRLPPLVRPLHILLRQKDGGARSQHPQDRRPGGPRRRVLGVGVRASRSSSSATIRTRGRVPGFALFSGTQQQYPLLVAVHGTGDGILHDHDGAGAEGIEPTGSTGQEPAGVGVGTSIPRPSLAAMRPGSRQTSGRDSEICVLSAGTTTESPPTWPHRLCHVRSCLRW